MLAERTRRAAARALGVGALAIVIDLAFAAGRGGAGSWPAAVGACVLSAFGIALVGGAVGGLIGAGLGRLRSARPHGAPLSARLVAAGLAVAVMELVLRGLGSRGRETAELAAVAVAGLLAFTMYRPRAVSAAGAEEPPSGGGRARRAAFAAVALSTLSGVAFGRRGYLIALADTGPLIEAIWLVAAALASGSAFVGRPPAEPTPVRIRVRRAVFAGAASILLGGTMALRSAGPADTAPALSGGAPLATRLNRRLSSLRRPAAVAVTAADVRACRPGETLAAPAGIGQARGDAPDILLITVDGVRYDHTSLPDESTHPNTPLLRERAGGGAVFERAYSPASSTRQSFRAIFTGLENGVAPAPHDTGFPWALTLAPEQPTLASYLRAAGYRTIAYVSKVRAFPASMGALAGFDEVDDRIARFQDRHNHSAQWIVSGIVGRLAEPPEDGVQPRFVWTHLIEPHFPYTHGPTDLDARMRYGEGLEARHDIAVRFIDEQLDRLIAFALGPERRDRTLVIITADHGEAFGEHHNARHGGTVYEEEIHVPLVVLGAGVRAGRHARPVSLVGLLPTILEAAGVEPPAGVCRGGFWASIATGAEPPDEPVYAAAIPDATMNYDQRALIRGDEKLIVDGATGDAQLFDLAADPGEASPIRVGPRVDAAREAFAAFRRERGL